MTFTGGETLFACMSVICFCFFGYYWQYNDRRWHLLILGILYALPVLLAVAVEIFLR